MNKHRKNNHQKNEENLKKLYWRYVSEFGQPDAEKIFKILIQELWGNRIRIPTMQYFHIQDRNKKIKASFYGGNYGELAIRFRLTATQIRRIVHSD